MRRIKAHAQPFLIIPFLTGLLFACAAPGTPLACSPDPFHYFPEFEKSLKIVNSGPITREELKGNRLKVVLDAYNAHPPATKHEADVAYTFTQPGRGSAALVFVLDDCVVVSGSISIRQLMMLLENVNGKPPPPSGMREA